MATTMATPAPASAEPPAVVLPQAAIPPPTTDVPTHAPSGELLLPGIPGKRCAHCNTQTTPLWRNGPDGPKTLCNACGVRDNRRHAKHRNASKPRKPKSDRPHKPKPRLEYDSSGRPKRVVVPPSLFADSQDDGLGGRRSSRWNAGLLTKRAKAEAAANAAPKRPRPLPAMDVDGDGNIHLPTFSIVGDYEQNSMTGFKPSSEYVSARPHTVSGRFAPCGPAPLYSATSDDVAWLDGVNAQRADAEALKERQLETLFDVFEEASWHAGDTVASAQAAYDVLGFGDGGGGGASGAEARATKSEATEMFSCEDLSWADEPLVSPMTALDETFAGIKAAAGEKKHSSEKRATRNGTESPPHTPSESQEPECARGSPSVPSENGGDGARTPPGSPAPGSVDAATASDDTDVESDDERVGSGNGKSSDLAANGKMISEWKRVTRGAKAAARPAKTLRNGTRAGISPVTGGASELQKVNTTTKNKNKNKKHTSGAGAGAGAAKRDPNVPTDADVALAYAYYRELRAKNGGVALIARFARPAPASLRVATLGGGKGADADDGGAVAAAKKAAEGKYQFVLGVEAVRAQQRERAARGEAIKEASRRRRRRACFNPAASKRRRKQQTAMEIALELPMEISHEPLYFYPPTPSPTEEIASEDFHEATPPPHDDDAHTASDWESEEDVDVPAADARDQPSVMRKVASAASVVFSRVFLGSGTPVTPKKRRTPRFGSRHAAAVKAEA